MKQLILLIFMIVIGLNQLNGQSKKPNKVGSKTPDARGTEIGNPVASKNLLFEEIVMAAKEKRPALFLDIFDCSICNLSEVKLMKQQHILLGSSLDGGTFAKYIGETEKMVALSWLFSKEVNQVWDKFKSINLSLNNDGRGQLEAADASFNTDVQFEKGADGNMWGYISIDGEIFGLRLTLKR